MPDESSGHSEEPANQAPEEPKSRRISNKIPRKAAKQIPNKEVPLKSDSEDTIQSEAPPIQPASETTEIEPKPDNTEAGKQESKRNNRRRRGKGKSSSPGQNPDQSHDGKAPALNQDVPEEATDRRESSNPNAQKRPLPTPRKQADPKEIAKKAWKIFLAEVSEEGVALISDNDARELSRRCFRLAELFIEEQSRRS